jgi:hypothetical protein
LKEKKELILESFILLFGNSLTHYIFLNFPTAIRIDQSNVLMNSRHLIVSLNSRKIISDLRIVNYKAQVSLEQALSS